MARQRHTLITRGSAESLYKDVDLSIENNFAGPQELVVLGSELAIHRAAILTSAVASCKNNLVEPWADLRTIFDRLARKPTTDQLDNLFPDQWLNQNPNHRWESPKPDATSERSSSLQCAYKEGGTTEKHMVLPAMTLFPQNKHVTF